MVDEYEEYLLFTDKPEFISLEDAVENTTGNPHDILECLLEYLQRVERGADGGSEFERLIELCK